MVKMDPIQLLNNKVVRSEKQEFKELQCNSLYAHNTTSNKLKSLTIDDSDALIVTNGNTLDLTYIFLSQSITAGFSVTSPSQTLKQLGHLSVLLETNLNISDIVFEIEISNDDINFYSLDTHYYTEHIQGLSNQVQISGFKAKYIRFRMGNASLDDIIIGLSYIQ